MEEKETVIPAENSADTTIQETITTEIVEEQPKQEEVIAPDTPDNEIAKKEEPLFTQDKLNTIVQDRVNKIYNKYGVKTSEELDKVFEEAKSYKRELLFLKNNIDTARTDDICVYFKGLGQEITQETLNEQLNKHPEWVKKIATINVGNVDRQAEPQEDKRKVLKDWGL